LHNYDTIQYDMLIFNSFKPSGVKWLHTALTHPFNFLTFRHPGAQDWVPEWPNVKKLKKVG